MKFPALARGALAALPPLALCLLAACGERTPRQLFSACTPPAGSVPFAFEVGGRRLSGFIDPPDTPGPHPAVLLVQDRGRTDVTQGGGDFARLRAVFREAGIASVVWDKGGTGCSGGDYGGIADLYARADEVVAALAALEGRSDVDAARMGLWAIGEGGWVAPMAAARSDAPAFVITVGAPGRSPVHQRLYLARANLELGPYAAEDVEAWLAAYERALARLVDLADYEDYRRIAEPLAREPFFARLDALGYDVLPREARYRELQSSAALRVSADVFLPAVDAPVLALFGDRDTRVDWRESVRVYRAAFAGRPDGDLTVRVFEEADHRLCRAGDGAGLEARLAGEMCRYVEGYPEAMIEWLEARGLTGS